MLVWESEKAKIHRIKGIVKIKDEDFIYGL